jgi:hypothetical protein
MSARIKSDYDDSFILPAAQGTLERWSQAWQRFFFAPGDPTTLGLIRICAGLLVVYIHAAYSFDLQQLFGRDAWLDLKTITKIRTENPIVAPASDWDESRMGGFMAPLPADAEEREQLIAYMSLHGIDRRRLEGLTQKEIEARWAYAAEWGIDKDLAYAQGHYFWSVWFHVTDPRWMVVVHCCILAAMVMFTIGLATRITSVLTFLGALSYINRAPMALFGMDAMMMIALFYLMIGASGAALSVDRYLARWWARRHGAAPTDDFLHPEPSVSANLALRMMQIHFCFIYMASGLSKLQGPTWWNGTAIWGTLANYSFCPMNIPLYMAWLKYMSHHRWLWELSTTAGTAFTLFLEVGFAFLVWNRNWRWLMVSGAVMLHIGIGLFMGLTVFSMIMITLVMSFIPAETTRGCLVKIGGWIGAVFGPSSPRAMAPRRASVPA